MAHAGAGQWVGAGEAGERARLSTDRHRCRCKANSTVRIVSNAIRQSCRDACHCGAFERAAPVQASRHCQLGGDARREPGHSRRQRDVAKSRCRSYRRRRCRRCRGRRRTCCERAPCCRSEANGRTCRPSRHDRDNNGKGHSDDL